MKALVLLFSFFFAHNLIMFRQSGYHYSDCSEDNFMMQNHDRIIGLWSVDSVIQKNRVLKVKAFYFFGKDSTYMYSSDSTVRDNLIEGYKYFVRNDTIYTMNVQEETQYIYKDETKVIMDIVGDKMRLRSVATQDQIILSRRRY